MKRTSAFLIGFVLLVTPLLAGRAAAVDSLSGPIVNPANGHLYILLDQANWTDSEAAAVLLGGHLATIDDAAEDSFVFDTFSNFGGQGRNLWIGLNDRASEGVFEWSSGAPVVYMNFDSGKWYQIRVRVTPTRIGAWIDDRQVVDQDIASRKITLMTVTVPALALSPKL